MSTSARDPSCHLVEGRFYDDTHEGFRIDCIVDDHADRECPGEGVMFQSERANLTRHIPPG